MMLRGLVSGVCLFAAASAFAGENPNIERATLQQLQAKCERFINDVQMKPQVVKVICSEISTQWRPIEALPTHLVNVRNIGAQVELKNFQTPNAYGAVSTPVTAASCPRYREVERSVGGIETTISCQQLLAIKDLAAFCTPLVDSRLRDDTGAAKYRDTGKVVSFCK